jgi:sialic acid synthase SpsE/sugar phosphate isomerase/epimerase
MAELIAEIGINHQGNLKKVFAMIDQITQSGTRSVKLQYRSDKSFFDAALEMGSTIVAQELEGSNLNLSENLDALNYIKKNGMLAGVSFFRLVDVKEFCGHIIPDFFKIPSAEALNFDLIKYCQQFKRPVIVSTGGLNYEELKYLSEEINFTARDCVMYCVANYPAALGSSDPQYIAQYRKLFNCKVGYSSHDECWEVIIAFLAMGVDCVERHYCESKNDQGLDISTSSDLCELSKLQVFCDHEMWTSKINFKAKGPNQGEVQNIKDLGSGYYFKRNYRVGETVRVSDLKIMSPCRGIKAGSISDFTIKKDAEPNMPLTLDHKDPATTSFNFDTKQAISQQISLPVRLHDFSDINDAFELQNYEWHLSYKEVDEALEVFKAKFCKISKNKKFSIHLPDYISSKNLIDPFAIDPTVKEQSLRIIEKVADFANELQTVTSSPVPIVGSLSVLKTEKAVFYERCIDMINHLSHMKDVQILPQFLPKKAWYFGGSTILNLFCSIEDLQYLKLMPHGICLDTAHCIMAANYANAKPSEWFEKLLPLANHIHISDAKGIDGEGVPFGEGQLGNMLNPVMEHPVVKVIEQWEGHLNDFRGFRESLQFLSGSEK